jgi:hypothetical protein
MLHAGLDLSRRKIDICLLFDRGEHLDQLVVPTDVGSLKTLAHRIEEVHGQPVCAVIESMTGARIVHDTLEACGWDVEIADAQKAKGLAPLACKTDRIDTRAPGAVRAGSPIPCPYPIRSRLIRSARGRPRRPANPAPESRKGGSRRPSGKSWQADALAN